MMQPWSLPLAGACAEQVTRLHDVLARLETVRLETACALGGTGVYV
jgi:hypothetical protein